MTAFDQLSTRYADLWSTAPEGVRQRGEVWQVIDSLFVPGERILDLGCGTGDDAVHLAARGVGVLGIDASPAMVAQARARGVEAIGLAMERLEGLPGVFDGALSNFGALNCVQDVPAVARALAAKIRPGGTLAICVLSRVWWRESARFALAGDFRRATRRWSGRTMWRGVTVHYRTVANWRTFFEPHFSFTAGRPIGGGDHRLLFFRRRA